MGNQIPNRVNSRIKLPDTSGNSVLNRFKQ